MFLAPSRRLADEFSVVCKRKLQHTCEIEIHCPPLVHQNQGFLCCPDSVTSYADIPVGTRPETPALDSCFGYRSIKPFCNPGNLYSSVQIPLADNRRYVIILVEPTTVLAKILL
jgi:hypothetical protein